jgi:excisionase family DNA binding protein
VSVLSVKQVALRLNVCNMTVYRLIHAGQLPAIKVGKSYRITEDAYRAYVKRVRTRGNAS